MKNILAIGISLILLTAGTALAGKPGEPAAASGNMELVGFSTATTAPNVGLFAMTNLCQAEFVDSRMCTSEEIMKTVNIPTLPSGTTAWVQPVISSTGAGITDISGFQSGSSGNLSCNRWSTTTSGFYGLVVSNLGVISYMGCFNQYLPVACCAPAQ